MFHFCPFSYVVTIEKGPHTHTQKKYTLTPPIEIVKHTATNRRRLAQLSTACSTRKPGSYSRAEMVGFKRTTSTYLP